MQGYNESILKDIGRSYVVSSLLPASMFTVLALFIFWKLIASALSIDEKGLEENEATLFAGAIFVLILITVWIGFALYSSQNFIIPLYEGYQFPQWMKKLFIQRRIKKYEKKYVEELEEIKKRFNEHVTDLSNRPVKKHVKKFKRWERTCGDSLLLLTQALEALRDLDQFLPINYNVLKKSLDVHVHISTIIDKDWVLPTRLGNVLRTGEYYPNQRYMFDGTNIWTRLQAILPEKFVSDLEENNNRLFFLLNSSLSIALLSGVSLLISLLPLFFIFFRSLNLFLSLCLAAPQSIYGVWRFAWSTHHRIITLAADLSDLMSKGFYYLAM